MASSIEVLALQLARILQPLEEQLAPAELRDFFAELGLQLPPELDAQAELVDACAGAAAGAARLAELVPELLAAIDAEDVAETVRLGAEILAVVGTLIPDLRAVATALGRLGGALPGVDPASLAAFAGELAGRLVEYLVVNYLDAYHPVLLRVLALVGVVELIREPGVPADPTQPPHTVCRLRADRLGQLLSDPEGMLRDRYGWGDAAFDGALFLERLHDLVFALDVPAVYDSRGLPPSLSIMLLRIQPRTDLSPPGMELSLELELPTGLRVVIPLFGPGLGLQLGVTGELTAGVGITVQPPADVTLVPPAGSVQGMVELGVVKSPAPPREELALLSIPGGSGLFAAGISLGLVAGFQWDSDSGSAKGDLGIAGSVQRGRLAITLAEADGFVAGIVGGFALEADFDLGISWTAGGGFAFTGSGALEIQLPVHVSIGPIELTAVTLALGINGGSFPATLTANVTGALGPLVAVVEEVGLRATLSFPADRPGNLGPADLAFAFQPPKGVGLALDAGVVKGGGYLYIDAERGEYAGALELMFAEFVTLTAVGLITTRMPDGSDGFSLLVIINAEFGTGLQLGLGFTLLGVGGLIGLNRSMNLEPLVESIRTGSVESILFPRDVVANAPKIISDLRAIFPPEEGTFLIGPMAKLGWGTPTLVSLTLGIIIEIPGNIAILGVLRIALPAGDASVLVLQVSFVGAIEFDRQRIWFFATLFESHILTVPIEGEMGLLVGYGADANFVVSIGGFHPRFVPPPLPFPSPRRVGVSLVNESYARVRIDGYFAVTSNTVQFGAHAELFFGLDGLSVDGDLSFDALFQFSPFAFIIEVSASLSVKVFGAGLFSIRIRGAIEGPTPYRARGEGSISLLFFSISADFDVVWGEERDTLLPPIDVLPLARAEFEKAENWRALPPAGSSLLVSLRSLPADEAALVLHPLGVLRVSQRFVPLALTLDKIGNQRPGDVNHLSLAITGGGLSQVGPAQEQFAPAQFQDLSDADKLSSPAFGPQDGGIDLSASGAQLRSSRMVRRVVRYEEIIIDSNFKRFARRFVRFPGVLFDFFLGRGSVTKSVLSQAHRQQYQPFADRMDVMAEGYAVVLTTDNTPYAAASVGFASEASAREYVTRAVSGDPNLAEQIQVVPTFEAAV